jgi:hypothetical protein
MVILQKNSFTTKKLLYYKKNSFTTKKTPLLQKKLLYYKKNSFTTKKRFYYKKTLLLQKNAFTTKNATNMNLIPQKRDCNITVLIFFIFGACFLNGVFSV